MDNPKEAFSKPVAETEIVDSSQTTGVEGATSTEASTPPNNNGSNNSTPGVLGVEERELLLKTTVSDDMSLDKISYQAPQSPALAIVSTTPILQEIPQSSRGSAEELTSGPGTTASDGLPPVVAGVVNAETEVDETAAMTAVEVSTPRSSTSSIISSEVASSYGSSDHYCLRWTNHGNHVLSVFSQLLRDEALVDVTLAAEGQSVRAHKMVLSACSSFFRTLFVSHPERHPIIILKDTKFDELKTLLEFMYKGEVSVEYGQLGTLLKTAENLRVKGLAEVTTNYTSTNNLDTATANASAADDESDPGSDVEGTETSPIVLDPELGRPIVDRPRSQMHEAASPHHRSLRPQPYYPPAGGSSRSLYKSNYHHHRHSNYGHAGSVEISATAAKNIRGVKMYPQRYGVTLANTQDAPLPSMSHNEQVNSRLHHPPESQNLNSNSSQHELNISLTSSSQQDNGALVQETLLSSSPKPNRSTFAEKNQPLRSKADDVIDQDASEEGSCCSRSSPAEAPNETACVDKDSGVQDLRRTVVTASASASGLNSHSSAQSPTPVSGASPDFRNRGSDSLPGRPLSHYNHWRPRPTVSLDAEASESSESDDCDNYHLSRSPGQDAQLRRPPVMVHGRDSTGVDNTNTPTQVVAALGSTDRLGSPQPFTQTLKKEETDWEMGTVCPPAASGTSQSPVVVPPSRSPSFSESSSEYGRHADQEQQEERQEKWQREESASDPSIIRRLTSEEEPIPTKEQPRPLDPLAINSPVAAPLVAPVLLRTVSLVENDVDAIVDSVERAPANTPSRSWSSQSTPIPQSLSCVCVWCGLILSSASRLARHVLLVHNVQEPNPLAPQERGQKRRHFSALHLGNRPSTSKTPFLSCLNLMASQFDMQTSALTSASAAAAAAKYFPFRSSFSSPSRSRHSSSDVSFQTQVPLLLSDPGNSLCGSSSSSGTSLLRVLGSSQDASLTSSCTSSPASSSIGVTASELETSMMRLDGVHERAMAMLSATPVSVLNASFGSLSPGVSVLTSLMSGCGGGAGGSVDPQIATDLSLGSVLYPSTRLQQQATDGQTCPALNHQMATETMTNKFSNLPFTSLSLQAYSAAAPGLTLATSSGTSSATYSSKSVMAAAVAASVSSNLYTGQQTVASVVSSSSRSSATAGVTADHSEYRSNHSTRGGLVSSGSLLSIATPPALCKFCGKSFVELTALMAHLPFHTGERPFRCDFCGKAFKLRHHMKDHARVHTGERPFPCRQCGKTFSRSTILKAHEKTHLPKSERANHCGLSGQPSVGSM